MSTEILTCYLDFNVSEDLDVSNGFCLDELKSHIDIVAELSDILSTFLVSDLMKSRGAKYFIDSNIDIECLLKGVIPVTLRWREGVALIDADCLPGKLVEMLRDAIEILVIERYIPDLTYKLDSSVDCLYELDLSGDPAVCLFRSEEMVSLVNKIERLLVNLDKFENAAELHLYSETEYLQMPPIEGKRHFMDIKESIEEEVECSAFTTAMRGENKVFKIDLTGKSRQYYIDDVSIEMEDYLARRVRYDDRLRLLVRPVRSVKRGVVGPVTRYSLVACLEEKDGLQQWIRFPDVNGRRK